MKKCIAICAALALALSGCSNSETVNSSSNSTDTTKDIFQDIFCANYQNIGQITYSECMDLMDEPDFETQTSEIIFQNYLNERMAEMDSHIIQDNLECITVIDPGHPESFAKLYFYPGDQYQYTLTEVRFGDDNYYIAVSNNLHMTDLSYYTYGITNEPRRTAVHSLGQLNQYMFTEVPDLSATYQEWVSGLDKLNVELAVETEIAPDGMVTFLVRTNLPDNAELLMILYSGGHAVHQQTSVLWNGEAELRPSELLNDKYTLSILMPSPRESGSMIFETIGMNGEALTGDYVIQSETGPGKAVEANFDFDFS